MPRGIKRTILRWVKTGSGVWQLEAWASRYFVGIVSSTSDTNTFTYHCWAMSGEATDWRLAAKKVEASVVPVFRYALSTTWGSNRYALFELESGQAAVCRAAGSLEHCKEFHERALRETPPRLTWILSVHRFHKE